MRSAFHAIEVEFDVLRPGGGKVVCTRGAESVVINVDRSQEPPVPKGAQLLSDFLDEFQSLEDVAPHVPEVRQEIAHEQEKAGAPVSLRTLRLRRGLSQQEFARQIGTSQSAVSLLETRRQKPTEDTIRAMAATLSVDFNTLMDALANG